MTRGARLRALLQAGVALYLAAVAVIAVLLCAFADAFWPATLLAFGPRWIWGAPLVVLVPAALAAGDRRRRLLAALAVAAAIWVGPILDLRLPVARLGRLGLTRDLRVMTYNIGGGEMDPEALRAQVRELGPDLFAVQERSFPFAGKGIPAMPYSGSCGSEQCLWSRFPITSTDARDPADLLARHGSGSIALYQVRSPRGPLRVLNVHLATVREGVASVMQRAFRGVPALEENTRERALESEIARAYADRGSGSLLVMGDFNLPVESAIYRRSWGSLPNALSETGFGLVSTKHTRWHGVRIDHVLAGPGWQVLRAWVGPGLGGDHRPVLADLHWAGTTPDPG